MMVKVYTKVKKIFSDKKIIKDILEVKKDSIGKKVIKKILAKPKKNVPRKKTLMEKTFEQIDEMLNGYNQFIKKDFIMILHEANAMLRAWKNNILNKIEGKKGDNLEEDIKISQDIQEISQIYSRSEIALSHMIDRCHEYQYIIKGNKSLVCPEQRLVSLNIQLENVIKTLRRGLEMTNIDKNSDYKYISSYVKSKGIDQSIGRSR
jgi:hypothetical protein